MGTGTGAAAKLALSRAGVSTFHKAAGIDGSLRWRVLRRQIFERDGWRCGRCGKAGRLECHHVKPLHKGGAEWEPGNLMATCRSCHVEMHKRILTPAERKWRDLVRDLL